MRLPHLSVPRSNSSASKTRIMVEQTTAVAPHRLGDFAGHLVPAEIEEIDDALHTVLGMLQ
ncbi:type II toxin-antitoxin system PemK/MazF family toxin [Streptosporangium roseum]|uniref:type II toxin-antitoxin system PemK/MazF family toxin n=1 Tax=Streptosporangium roseum TaxID=2001 RepID=UPI003D9DDC6A